MPIAGLTETSRAPRVGKVRLGIRLKSQKGTDYPKATDYFVVHPDHVTTPEMVERFHERYGEKPRELPIVLPHNHEEYVFPQFYKAYRSGIGLWCKGNGEIALRLSDDGSRLVERTCPCELLDEGKCRPMATLNFLLPEVPGIGVWQLTTSSVNSILNVNSSIRFIKSVAGRIAGLPLKLRLVPKDVQVNGEKKVVHLLDLAMDQMTLPELAQLASRLGDGQLFALPGPDEEDPEDVADAIEHFGHPDEREALHRQQAQAEASKVPAFGEHPLDEAIGKHFARLRILPGQRQALIAKHGPNREQLLRELEGRPTPGPEAGATTQAAQPGKPPASARAAAGKRGGKRDGKPGAGWPAQPAADKAPPPPEEPPPDQQRDAEWLF